MAAPATPRRRTIASQIALATRHHGPDHPGIPGLRAELATEALAEHIARVVESWPPLTDAQRERLALLLATDGPR